MKLKKNVFRTSMIAVLTACLLPASAAWASDDISCDAAATVRQSGYACAGVPFLSPGNDTRINAVLQMSPQLVVKFLPNPERVAQAQRTGRLVVPFVYDFSGWLDDSTSQSDDPSSYGIRSDHYADGEGGICRSVDSGAQAFDQALDAAKNLPDNERSLLRASRAEAGASCNTSTQTWSPPAGVLSEQGKQFALYLAGTAAFYRQNFAAATISFAKVSYSADPWLRETGLYMTGRAQLNAAQINAFDQDQVHPDAAGKVALGAADKVFHAYLSVYPKGRYAVSAIGLQRRVAWLGGDASRQSMLYEKAFAEWSPQTSNVPLGQLANELDGKLLTTNIDSRRIGSPLILAVVDLMRMRSGVGADDKTTLTLDELNAQRPRFAASPALHDYLLAAFHVYVDHKPDQALAILPPAPAASLDYMSLGQQMLRGFAFEDLGQPEKARELWRSLIPLAQYRLQRETLELALAIDLERAGMVDAVFAADSPVLNARLRAILLQHAASANLLRAQAQNGSTTRELRDMALYTLLYKELTRGRYADFVADLALIPADPSAELKPYARPAIQSAEGYRCPSVHDVAVLLQQNPTNAKGLNCVAEFVRLHPAAYSLIDDSAQTSAASDATHDATHDAALGSAPSQFPGSAPARMTIYQTVMNDTDAPAGERAYALYRAIRCYAPAGTNDCGGTDVSVSVRRQWFKTLKASYPGSTWAQSLNIYW